MPEMSETKAILVSARVLLSDPQSWTQGEMARSERGKLVVTNSKRARSFCIDGAIHRAGLKATREARDHAREVVRTQLACGNFGSIVGWNDCSTRTHAEVLAVLDNAIAAAS